MFIKNILSFAYLLEINIKYRYIYIYISIHTRVGLQQKILENKLNSYFL